MSQIICFSTFMFFWLTTLSLLTNPSLQYSRECFLHFILLTLKKTEIDRLTNVDRDQAKVFYNQHTCPKKMIFFTKETGAATHCQMGACFYANEVIFDWLDETFN